MSKERTMTERPIGFTATWWWLALELLLVIGWACWVGRDFMDMNPQVWPAGREFGMVLQSHFAWEQYATSGLGLFWNGLTNGGHPAFVDLHGAVLHPLVIVTTLALGAVNGAKIVVVCSLALAGLAQWWMARTLKLGSVARLWSAAMGIAGGHMAGRLDAGLFPLMLSAASVSMVLAAAVALARRTNARNAAILGIMLALAMVSGQAYMQIGMLLSLVPACFLLVLDERLRPRQGWGHWILAAGVGLLLCAAFWVPMAHHWPAMGKWQDPDFRSAQPLAAIPLNLVINDPEFFKAEILGKQPYAFLYVNYIGWLAVGLAALALALVPKAGRRLLSFFIVCAGLAFVASSAIPYKALAELAPDLVSGIRNPSLISSLAVPPILAMAAWGLDRLLAWRGLRLSVGAGDDSRGINLVAFVVIVALVFSVKSATDFGREWMKTTQVDRPCYESVPLLDTGHVTWVCAPFGDHSWNPHLGMAGFKATNVVLPWRWDELENPPPSIGLCREGKEPPPEEGAVATPLPDGMVLLEWPDRHYASLTSGDETVPVHAVAKGGYITLRYTSDKQAMLTVMEHHVTGWAGSLDGQPLYLTDEPWLTALVPPGEHDVVLQYKPLDVWVGLGISSAGLLLAVILMLFGGKTYASMRIEETAA